MVNNKQSMRSKVVTRRTYNRPLDEKGTKFETWEQTIQRVIEHQEWLWSRSLGHALSPGQKLELEELRQLMLPRKVAPSGRVLWLGGTETGMSRESSMFNCSFLRVQTVYDCVDTLWLLLNGCGVGFMPQVGTLNGFLKPIRDVEFVRAENSPSFRGDPHNRETVMDGVWRIQIGDSAEAWAKALGKLLARKVNVDKLIIDTTQIRGAGERLKGYGWICSGDEPLVTALQGIVALLNRKAGALLSRIDILDLVNWLGTVLSTRRSAEICLFNVEEPEWKEFATAKREYWKENPHRDQSNNSLVFNCKPSREKLEEIFQLMAAGGGSEPGFINAVAARTRAPWYYGCNPCFSGDSWLLTKNGYQTFAELSKKESAEIVNHKGDITTGRVWSNGVKEVVKLTLSSGETITCTPDHRLMREKGGEIAAGDSKGKRLRSFVQVKSTFSREEFFAGFLQGDGNTGRVASPGHRGMEVNIGSKDGDIAHLLSLEVSGRKAYSREAMSIAIKYSLSPQPLPTRPISDRVMGMELEPMCEFLAGLYSANGCVIKRGRVALKTTCIELAKQVVVMLSLMEIDSYITTNKPKRVQFKNGEYLCKESYDVNICRAKSIIKFAEKISFGQSYKRDSLATLITSLSPVVMKVEPAGKMEVFDFSEPSTHWGVVNGIVAHNCGEILLGDKSFCNLVEVDLAKFKGDAAGLQRAVFLIARANYRQTCVNLQDGILQEAWHLNNDFLRLCGVGITGVAKRPDMSPYDFMSIQRIALCGAYGMAMELGTPLPKNITTVKPSGTLSKIMDTTEGVHKPLGKYIFNNINFSKHDPLVGALREAGYKTIPHPTKADVLLVTFPVSHEGVEFDIVNGLEVNMETAVQQLERYKMLQTYWTQQNTSVTISYSPEEVCEIIDWLLQNWDSYVGVSFIYRADPTKTAADLGHPYLPQEVVTKEVWEAYVATLGDLNLDQYNSMEEIEDKECAGGVCPIK